MVLEGEDEDDDILTDETDADDSDNAGEHTDDIRPDMVSTTLERKRKMADEMSHDSNNLTQHLCNTNNLDVNRLYPWMRL